MSQCGVFRRIHADHARSGGGGRGARSAGSRGRGWSSGSGRGDRPKLLHAALQHIARQGVDLIIIFPVARDVELDIIYLPAVVTFKLRLGKHRLVRRHTRMSQCGVLRRIHADHARSGGGARGSRSAGRCGRGRSGGIIHTAGHDRLGGLHALLHYRAGLRVYLIAVLNLAADAELNVIYLSAVLVL